MPEADDTTADVAREDERPSTATTCPRCKGPVQRQQIPGSATDPRDPLPSDHHFWCSPCGKLWHPIEMPRPRATVKFTGDSGNSAACDHPTASVFCRVSNGSIVGTCETCGAAVTKRRESDATWRLAATPNGSSGGGR